MADRPPTVSIGLPVFNGERHISEAIDCALGQTFGDFELVICDNASTDRTAEICQDYAARDSRVRYVRNPENIGAAPNFNRTFELSRGRYFTWAAHDDEYAPSYLERCVEVLESQPGVVLVHTDIHTIDAAGDEFRLESTGETDGDSGVPPVMQADPSHLAETDRASDRFHDVLHGMRWCLQVFGVIRSDVLRETALQRSYYGADKVLLADLALVGRFHQIDEKLLFKRVHGGMSFFQTAEEKQQWIDPNAKHRIPPLAMVRDYTSAVVSARLPIGEKLRCLRSVAKMVTRTGLWQRIFVPGPNNDLGINFRSRNAAGRTSENASG